MALSANSVVEVRTAGNDTNGGGFVTGAAGTDYSQQDAKRTATGADDSTTDAVAIGTTTITSATAVFGTTIVGNIVYLQGGTGSLAAGWYQVTARASTTSITVDRNVAAGTGITMNIGGALASLGMAGGYGLVSGGRIFVKNDGTYTIASATANIATGCFSSSLTILTIEGYLTTRGDLGTPPLLQASGISTFVVITLTGASPQAVNLSVDGASLTSSRGFVVRGIGFLLKAANCTNSAMTHSTEAKFTRCTATGCGTQPAFLAANFIDCIAYNNTVAGFSISTDNATLLRCISDSNSGAGSDGFILGGRDISIINCVAYGNGRDGIRIGDTGATVVNNIGESNGGYGINLQSVNCLVVTNNATYGNASGGIGNTTGKGVQQIGNVAGSGSFFTDAPNQNFALNNTAGAGAAARAVGYPGVLPIGGTGYLDIGVLQHADPAGGSGGGIIARSLIAGDG